MTKHISRRAVFILFVVLAVACVAGVLVAQHKLSPRRWQVVEAGLLFRSGQLQPSVVEAMLKENGIRVVVDLTQPIVGSEAQEVEARAIAKLGIVPHRFPLRGDGTGEIESYAGALAAMAAAVAAGEPCLVHCSAGTERTGAAVAFFRMIVQGYTRERAVEEMIAAGMNPLRNTTVLPYMDANLPLLRRLLAERGVVSRGEKLAAVRN